MRNRKLTLTNVAFNKESVVTFILWNEPSSPPSVENRKVDLLAQWLPARNRPRLFHPKSYPSPQRRLENHFLQPCDMDAFSTQRKTNTQVHVRPTVTNREL